jgi:dienelactone hydrolase
MDLEPAAMPRGSMLMRRTLTLFLVSTYALASPTTAQSSDEEILKAAPASVEHVDQVLEEARREQAPADSLAAYHRTYFPEGDGPFPTVIAIPGCSGVSLDGPATDAGRPGDEADRLFRRHYARMAARLLDGGFGVLLVDYLTAENVANTCNREIPHERVGEYVAEALELAQTLPQVDTSRLFVIGWSHGGAGVIAWLEALGERVTPAAGAIAVYPECDSRGPWTSAVPVLVLLGEADDIALPERCDEIHRRLPEGTDVQVRRYSAARHGFDMTEGPEHLELGGGLTVGRNTTAGAEAWEEIFEALSRKSDADPSNAD